MNINSEARGIASEAMVEQALQAIQNKSKKGLRARIIGFIHARRHSELYRQHVDFLVTLEGGHEIPLQVKSSDRARRKFERRRVAYGRFIPVIVVRLGEAIESVINKVTDCIKLAFNKMQRETNRLIQVERIRSTQPRKRKPWCVRFHAHSMCH
jgi:hypothetical protein